MNTPDRLLHAGQVLSGHARLRPAARAANDLERSLTFGRWNARACQLANALTGLGLAKGDRIAVLAYNRLEWAEIYVAAAKAGLVVVPINFRLTPPEAAFIIQDSGACALMVEDTLCDIAEAARETFDIPPERWVQIGGVPQTGYHGYEDLLDSGARTEPGTLVMPEDPWCLMYTSGTTGNPKGAVRNHRAGAMTALMTQVEFRLNSRDHALLVMPMCHANSLYFFTASLFCGAEITIFSRPSFDPELCLDALRNGVTFSSMVPTHYAMLMDLPRSARGDTSSVEKLLVSSATAFPETKRSIMELFPKSGLYELYGSTEAAWVTVLHPDEQFDHLGTVGREVVGSAPVLLLDDDGNEVPDGTPGELFSSGPYQFDGYWNLPDATAAAFRGAYLSVGDVAARDEHGYIRLIDRKKNLIVSGGENIYPSEVEKVLSTHPDVREVAVVGLPDPKWSERVVACVTPAPGAAPDPDALIGWARERLAGFKRPREIVFLAEQDVPRTATGKIQHRRLRDRLARNRSV